MSVVSQRVNGGPAIRSYLLDPTHPGDIALGSGRIERDEDYAMVVKNTIVTCADAIFLAKGRDGKIEKKFYLARRAVEPMKGLWVFGGRLAFNITSPQEGLARVIKRETKLDISPERFEFHSVHMYTWAKVAQGDFPGRNLALNHLCVLTQEEIDAIVLDKEYEPDSFRGYARDEIADEIERRGSHAMLLDLFDQIHG
ncbi:MAG TPA: hypothetical protein VD967_02550 [Candidatus Paceibacterota bacterium]|nr:hypothetical protein [Candidatus Paceibacterota bacterium]